MVTARAAQGDDDKLLWVCRAIAVAATVGYALALLWDVAAYVGNGHDSIVASRGIMAENMIRWGIIGPVREYTLDRPGVDLYYSHHPYGTYWVIALAAKVLGRHAYVQRLVAILWSVTTPPLLWGIGKRLWGPVGGAVAALGYVVLPMTLAFGNFPGFEPPTVVACLLTTYGYVRFTEAWKRRWMIVSVIGVAVGTNVDWNYLLFLGAALGALVAALVFLPRRWLGDWFGRVPLRPFVQWVVLAGLVAGLSVLAWMSYFHRIGAIDSLLQSEVKRSKGSSIPVSELLEARRWWIDATFTPLAVLVGKIALPIFVVRVVIGRRLLEVFPLAIWLMAVVTYVKFKNGATVHIYWPYAFAAYFALGLGMTSTACVAAARWVLTRLHRPAARALVPRVALGCFALVALAILPDGMAGLRYARATGGRFDDNGNRTSRDVDKAQALEWMAEHVLTPDTIVELHEGMRPTWAFDWALHHPVRVVNRLPKPSDPPEERWFVADLEALSANDQRRLAEHRVIVVDHFAIVDREAPFAPVDAYVFDESEPTFLESYLRYATEPVRTVRSDAWATWELRDAWGQSPNPAPAGPPRTLDQLRIAHNAALAAGDEEAAARRLSDLTTAIDARVTRTFVDGTRLLGVRYVGGHVHELSVFFVATGPSAATFEFDIEATTEATRPLSLVPADDKVKQLGAPFVLPPTLWKARYVYAERCNLEHRPGRERYTGHFEPPNASPHPADDEWMVPLLALQ